MTDDYTARNNDAVDAARSQDGRRSEVLKAAISAPPPSEMSAAFRTMGVRQ
jgi:hypothetical protein